MLLNPPFSDPHIQASLSESEREEPELEPLELELRQLPESGFSEPDPRPES